MNYIYFKKVNAQLKEKRKREKTFSLRMQLIQIKENAPIMSSRLLPLDQAKLDN